MTHERLQMTPSGSSVWFCSNSESSGWAASSSAGSTGATTPTTRFTCGIGASFTAWMSRR